MLTIQTETASAEETRAIGAALGAALEAGAFVALSGPLGAGKTCLTQGIARGLGVAPTDPVVSPTFVLAREYQGRLRLVHLDAYRLGDLDELYMLGVDEALRDGRSVIVMEWPDRFEALVPADAVRLELAHLSAASRAIVLRAPAEIVERVGAAAPDVVWEASPDAAPKS